MRLYQPFAAPDRRCHAIRPGQQHFAAAHASQAPRLLPPRRPHYIISAAAAPTATDTPENGAVSAAAASTEPSALPTPSMSTAGSGTAAAAGANVGVDAVLQLQAQMQQQMQQMTAMLQAAQQQNALLWEQMQQMQQQMRAAQAAAGSTSSTADAAALPPPPTAAAVPKTAVALPSSEVSATPAAAAITSTLVTAEATAPIAAPPAAAGISEAAAIDISTTAAAGSLSPSAAAAQPMLEELQAPAAAAANEANTAANTAAAAVTSRDTAAAKKSKNAAAGAAKADRAAKKVAKVKGVRQQTSLQNIPAAAAAAAKAAASSMASSSISTLSVKQQLEQVQRMNEAMAKVLQQKQQQQQQQQSQDTLRASAADISSAKSCVEQQQQQGESEAAAEEQGSTNVVAAAAAPPVAAAELQSQQQQQQQDGQFRRPRLGVAVSQETAAAAAAALQELKQAQAKQAQAKQATATAAAAKPSPRRVAAAAAASSQTTPGSTAAAAAATEGGEAGDRRDVLLMRISNSRSARELQLLFERNQRRLRPPHLAALLAGLPESREGRTAILELTTNTAAAAADSTGSSSSSGLSKNSAALIAFADDLIKMLQLQLGQLRAEQLLDVIQAAAALQLSPRPAWLSSFQSASQPKLIHLNPLQLANMAAALTTAAAASRPSAAAAPAAKATAKGGAKNEGISPFWLKAWIGCAKQHCQALSAALQQQQQAVGETKQQAGTKAAAVASDSTAIGQLAVAAVQLKSLAIVPPPGNTDPSQPTSTKASGFVTQSDRLDFAAAMVAAAAAAAAIPLDQQQQQQGLDATAAADLSYALAEMITHQPGLILQLQEANADLRVSKVLAAVAAAAALDSMRHSSSDVLMRLLRGVMAAEAQPAAAWLSAMADGLSRQLRQLSASDSLTVVQALSSWYQQSQQQQQQQDINLQLQHLLGGLLAQTAAASAAFKPQQITEVLVTLGLHLGFKATAPVHQEAVRDLLTELSHAHNITLLNNSQLVQLLQALKGLAVPAEAGFIAAVQREGIKPRLVGALKPQEFADVAQALAGLEVQMEYEVLDGYWTASEGKLKQLTDADCVSLLRGLGALKQKPRAQLLGAFMADMLPRLPSLGRGQLCCSLEALAQLKLSKVDTQGVRVTTAQAVPAPAEFISELLNYLNPQLAGPGGATAAELASVLQALAALGFRPDQAWLTRALDGAAQKLREAVSEPGGEQALVNMLHALSRLSVKAPSEVLAEALHQLQAISDRLSAVQISTAMAALKTLDMDPNEQLMGSYLDRAAAAAAAGSATARDMAAVLQSLSAADVVPSVEWLQQYLEAVQQKLAGADSETLATIAHAAAAICIAGSSGSSDGSRSGSYMLPDSAFVTALVAVANARLGTTYMDASRILNTPDFKSPLTLSNLADCCWGLVKLGAQPKDLQAMVNLLISKSYDKFTQLTPQQLCSSAWAIAYCTSSSKGATAVKLSPKWLNQFAAAAAPEVQQLTKPQLSELVWALGRLYLGTDSQYATGTGSGSSDSNSDSSSSSKISSSVAAGSSIGRSSEVPVQQLLRAVAVQLDSAMLSQQDHQQQQESTPSAAASFPTASDISILVNLLTKFDCFASPRLLQHFCADVADQWDQLSDVSVADAAVAVARLAGPSSSGIIPDGCLDALSQQIHNRLQSLPPQLLCRSIWALATLGHCPGRQWLVDFAAAAFTQKHIAALQPGDFSDAVWALYVLDRLTEQQQQQQQQQPAETGSDSTAATVAAAGTSMPGRSSSSNSSLLTESLLKLLARKLDKRVNELQPSQILRLLLLAEGALTVVPSYSLPKGVSDGLSTMLTARAGLVAESTGVIGLVWAAARLGLRLHITTLDAFCKKIYAQLPSMSASDMARGFWASEKLGYRWLPPQLEEFDRQASQKLPEMSSSDVALLLAACKAFGHVPSQDWMRKFAEMPAHNLLQLSCGEAVQLAVQLADARIGLTAAGITWLPGWAEGLTVQQLQTMTGQQLFSIVKLLAEAGSTTCGTTGNTTGGTRDGTLYRPSDQMLSLLSLAVLPHVSAATADEVYCLLCGLASWQFVPPNGDVLLSAAAARLAEKLPVLTQHQAVQVLCAFANLGFMIGEPLQSKLCAKVMQEKVASSKLLGGSSSSSSSVTDAAATAELLSAVLTAIPNPSLQLYQTLMQQLDGALCSVPSATLLRLGHAMAAAGMQWQPTAAAAAAAAATTAAAIPVAFGQQYITAAVQAAKVSEMSLADIAVLCTALQHTGLRRKDDLSTADGFTQLLQLHLSAALSSRSSNHDKPAALVDITAIAGYITDCGYSPAAAVEQIQELLLLVLQDDNNSSSNIGVELSTEMTAAGEVLVNTQQQQQQQKQEFNAAMLAKLLLSMNTWGKRLSGSFASTAFDWSRYRLADARIETLGPLLIGLSAVCGKPPGAWMLDWSAVVLSQLDQAGPEDLAAIGTGLAQVGSTSDLCRSTWMQQYAQAARQHLADLSEQQLEVVMYSLYSLRFSPSREWVGDVVKDLESRAPATDTPAARALAYVRQLKAV